MLKSIKEIARTEDSVTLEIVDVIDGVEETYEMYIRRPEADPHSYDITVQYDKGTSWVYFPTQEKE